MPTRARQLSVVARQPPTKLQEAGHAWLAHLRAEGRSVKTLCEGGRTPATVGTYMRDVKSFLRWLTAEGDLERTPAIPKISQPLRHPESPPSPGTSTWSPSLSVNIPAMC